ncbi:MAG TPA: hypothetical protein VNW54_07955 [Granulicella sp.]|jgi:hypothetical protein|nr:hypothetical protein [Granulicella sp.]
MASTTPQTAPHLGPELSGAPAEYQLPAARSSHEEARQWCHNLATTHYENFHVATFFLPKRFCAHFQGGESILDAIAQGYDTQVRHPEVSTKDSGAGK